MNSIPNSETVVELRRALECVQTVCVVGHLRPDGDCVGSQLAVAYALHALGKDVVAWNQDPMPSNFEFLDPKGLFGPPVADGRRFDLVVSTDCASYKRLGRVTEAIENRGSLWNIDHHASNPGYGDVNWIEEERSSTGEILVDVFEAMGWALTPAIANLLYTAISTDTGSFQFPTTTPQTLRIAANLVENGADLELVSRQSYHSNSEAHMALLRHVYGTFEVSDDGRLVHFILPAAVKASAGANRGDTEGLIDHVRAISSVQVAVMFEETEDGSIRISLRSKTPEIDVNQIAKSFGGGGHAEAAGATLEPPVEQARDRVLAAIRERLNA